MSVLLSIAIVVVTILFLKRLFSIGNGLVDAFVTAHKEIEEEAQIDPRAYDIKFYSPHNS